MFVCSKMGNDEEYMIRPKNDIMADHTFEMAKKFVYGQESTRIFAGSFFALLIRQAVLPGIGYCDECSRQRCCPYQH